MTSVAAHYHHLIPGSSSSSSMPWQSRQNKDLPDSCTCSNATPPTTTSTHPEEELQKSKLGLCRRNAASKRGLADGSASWAAARRHRLSSSPSPAPPSTAQAGNKPLLPLLLQHHQQQQQQPPPPKKKVHFHDQESVQVYTYTKDSYSDDEKATLWWTKDERQATAAHIAEICQKHWEQNSMVQQQVQKLWDQCTRMGATRRGCSTRNNNNSDHVIEADESIRGLELLIVPGMMQKRRNAMEGILNAQLNVAATHPTMQLRILSKTAAHLSRSSVCFAHAMAAADAQIVAAQYDN